MALQQGSRGAEVTALQKKLGVTADGVFGPKTAAALKAFQKKNGLPESGVVDTATQTKLGGAAASPSQPAAAPPKIPSPGGGTGSKVSGYGFVAAFLNAHPDVRSIVDAAVKGNWDTTRFETALKGTQWYRTRSEAQRKWDVESAQDPTQAAKNKAEATTQVRNMAGQWGITLTQEQIDSLAKQIYVNGADEATVRVALSGFTPNVTDKTMETGQIGASVEDLRKMAYEYGVPVSDSRLQGWTRDIVAGKQTPEGLEAYFQQSASSLYPQFAKQLQAGMTTRDLFDPYIQIAQRTLEVTPEQVDILDPKWVPVQQTVDGPQVLSLQDWQKKIRSDASYGWQHTAGARDEAYSMTSRLARLFGGYG